MANAYQYVIVHKSCRNHPGVLACQVAHAAGESLYEAMAAESGVVVLDEDIDPRKIYVVALEAESDADLRDLASALAAANIRHALIEEPDPPYNGAATAVGITPSTDRARLKPFLEKFKLLR